MIKENIQSYTLSRSGEDGLSLIFHSRPSPDMPFRMKALLEKIAKHFRIKDWVISYTSLLIIFDSPSSPSMLEEERTIRSLVSTIDAENQFQNQIKANTHRIPVCYDTRFGIDLDELAKQKSMDCSKLVSMHAETEYTIYALGFIPGFPFCGIVPPQLVTPRKKTPRQRVPKGSVGIAGEQTGVYPIDSPGGWNIIGRTPITIFDPATNYLAPFAVGDKIVFYPITYEDFEKFSKQ